MCTIPEFVSHSKTVATLVLKKANFSFKEILAATVIKTPVSNEIQKPWKTDFTIKTTR